MKIWTNKEFNEEEILPAQIDNDSDVSVETDHCNLSTNNLENLNLDTGYLK